MRIPGIPYVQGRNSYLDGDGKHYGIAIHNTSNDASDSGEASYATRRTDGISSHLYVDADSVTQSLDTDARAGHAGSTAGNDNAIAVEITGGNAMSRDWWLSNVAWERLGYALAYLIRNDPDYAGFQVRRASVAEMRANPRVKALYSHDDMRQAWGGTTHTDPGPSFPWDRLIGAINAALTPVKPAAALADRKDPLMRIVQLPDGAQHLIDEIGRSITYIGDGGDSAALVAVWGPPAKVTAAQFEIVKQFVPKAPATPVSVDASQVAAALAADTTWLASLAKAVNDDLHARTEK